MAKDYVPENIQDKANHIARKLERINKKILERPDWSDAELKKLSAGMRGVVLAGLQERDELRRRIARLRQTHEDLS